MSEEVLCCSLEVWHRSMTIQKLPCAARGSGALPCPTGAIGKEWTSPRGLTTPSPAHGWEEVSLAASWFRVCEHVPMGSWGRIPPFPRGMGRGAPGRCWEQVVAGKCHQPWVLLGEQRGGNWCLPAGVGLGHWQAELGGAGGGLLVSGALVK